MTWDVCGYRALRWRSVCDGEEFPYTVMNVTEGKLRPPDFDSFPASSISPIPPPWSLGMTDQSRRSAGRLRLTSPNDTTREETFFYHGHHLVSMSYITDNHAYNG